MPGTKTAVRCSSSTAQEAACETSRSASRCWCRTRKTTPPNLIILRIGWSFEQLVHCTHPVPPLISLQENDQPEHSSHLKRQPEHSIDRDLSYLHVITHP